MQSDGAGTLKDISSIHGILQASDNSLAHYPTELWSLFDLYQPGGVTVDEKIAEPELSYLAQCYCKMYPDAMYTARSISAAIQRFSQVKVGKEVFDSENSHSERSSYIPAKWCGRNGDIDTSLLHPACVLSYLMGHRKRYL